MAKIWAFLNQKGGPGKTTLSTNVAHGLHLRGFKVLLGDTDPQGNARDWNNASDGSLVPTIGLDRESLHADIKAVADGYDYIILDGAPLVTKLSAAAVKAADVVIIPVQPSAFDIWATAPLVEVIKARQEVTDGKPMAFFVVSRAITNSRLSREVAAALEGFDLPALSVGTTQRVAYPTVAGDGHSVYCDKAHAQAQGEIDAIIDELLKYTNEGIHEPA